MHTGGKTCQLYYSEVLFPYELRIQLIDHREIVFVMYYVSIRLSSSVCVSFESRHIVQHRV